MILGIEEPHSESLQMYNVLPSEEHASESLSMLNVPPVEEPSSESLPVTDVPWEETPSETPSVSQLVVSVISVTEKSEDLKIQKKKKKKKKKGFFQKLKTLLGFSQYLRKSSKCC